MTPRFNARRTRGPETHAGGARAFTLLELLVVIGLVTVLAGLVLAGAGSGGRSAALQSGEAMLADLLAATRIKAMATGHRVRLLVHHEPAAAARFRRRLALQEDLPGEGWTTREVLALPAGVYVLPARNRIPAGLLPEPARWRTADGSEALGSSALSGATVQAAAGSATAETWEQIHFVPAGTVSTSGTILLATGRPRPSGTVTAGASPCELDNPDAVRGLTVSVYGLVRPVPSRSGN